MHEGCHFDKDRCPSPPCVSSLSPRTPLMLTSLLCGTLLFALASYLIFRALSRSKGLPYPPGPPPSFITGNLTELHLHKEHIWFWYTDLAKEYGTAPPLL